MVRTQRQRLTKLVLTLGCVVPAALGVGCGSADVSSDDVSESAATLGVQVDSCSLAASSGYGTISSNLTLSMGTVTGLVLGVVNGYVTVNGYPCVKPAAAGGAKLTPAMVKKISITGTAGDDQVVIDTLRGALGTTILAVTGGITVDLDADATNDSFSIRGSDGNDRFTAGLSSSDLYFEISGDTTADIRVSNAELVRVALSAGDDTFSGMGGIFSATHLATMGTVTALTPVTLGMTLNGSDGDDTLTGGVGNDSINGGPGNDTLKAAELSVAVLSDGDDSFVGGTGTDEVDYAARTADLTVVMDGMTAGGDPITEADLIANDVENFVSGSGNDTLTGNQLANHIQGGAGDDLIDGGLAGTCTADADVLDGQADDDTFNQGALADCGDVINGGAGTDRVNYQARSADLLISLDGAANDGDSAAGMGERDNVKSDVEIVISGSGDDTIIGSANPDELHGGPGVDALHGGAGNDTLTGDSGNDTLNGEAGDDTFDESGVDPEYTVTENKGDHDDILNGGLHTTSGADTVDYSARPALAPVTATLCMDPGRLTGGSALSMVAACTDLDGDPLLGEADEIVNVTHLIGGLGDDTLTGHTGDDVLEGRAGDDTLSGGAGNDWIYGEDGVDTMFGDAGDDYLDGDAGDGDLDVYDGDNVINDSAADICVVASGETAINCEP